MIRDLQKLIGVCFLCEQTSITLTLLGVFTFIFAIYAMFKLYGVIALITWYLTRYFTRKAVLNNEH